MTAKEETSTNTPTTQMAPVDDLRKPVHQEQDTPYGRRKMEKHPSERRPAMQGPVSILTVFTSFTLVVGAVEVLASGLALGPSRTESLLTQGTPMVQLSMSITVLASSSPS